jgi:hypothetical protein
MVVASPELITANDATCPAASEPAKRGVGEKAEEKAHNVISAQVYVRSGRTRERPIWLA